MIAESITRRPSDGAPADSLLPAPEGEEDVARFRGGGEAGRAGPGRVEGVVGDPERVVVERIDAQPRRALERALGVMEVDVRGGPGRVDPEGAAIEDLARGVADHERVAGE